MSKVLIISTSNELMRMMPQDIVFICSEGNYSIFTLVDKSEFTFSFNLQHSQELIVRQLADDASQFMRIGKSLIVNRDYIFRIVPSKQLLVLAARGMSNKFELTASKEALRQVKQLIEKEL